MPWQIDHDGLLSAAHAEFDLHEHVGPRDALAEPVKKKRGWKQF